MILGVSYDTPEENKNFKVCESFPYPLLSDEDHRMSALYGAAREPDHEYAAWPVRLSYLVRPDGKVARAWRVKDLVQHPGEVLEALRESAGS